MPLPPSFTGESQVGNQPVLNKSELLAFELPNRHLRIVYVASSTIRWQDYDPDTDIWSSATQITVTDFTSDTTFNGDVDENGNIMLIFGGGTFDFYAIILYANGSTSIQYDLGNYFSPLPNGNGTTKQGIGFVGNGKFVIVAFASSGTQHLNAITYDPMIGGFGNPRQFHSTAAGNVALIRVSADTAGTVCVVWRNTNGTTITLNFKKEGGSLEVVNTYNTGTGGGLSQIRLAMSRVSLEKAHIVIDNQTVAGSINRIITDYLRTAAATYAAPVNLTTAGNSSELSSTQSIFVDLLDNVHVVYRQIITSNRNIYYRRALAFSDNFSSEVQVSHSVSTETSDSGVMLRRGFTGDNMYIFWIDSRPTGGLNDVWWNVCTTCQAGPEKVHGSCVECNRGSLTVDHFKVAIGQTEIWGGGPLARGDQNLVQSGAAGTLIVDTNYPIESTGKLSSWYFYRGATSAVQLNIGSIYLLIYRGQTLIARVPNSEILPIGEGLYELSAGFIDVQEGDTIGIWMAPVSNSIKASRDPLSAGFVIYETNTALPAVGSTLPGVVGVQQLVTTLVVRGVVVEEDIIQTGFYQNGTFDDAAGYLDFVLSTNAWADGSVVLPALLFDDLLSTAARAIAGTVGNVYYNVGFLAGNPEGSPPVERVEMDFDTPPAGGALRIYASVDTDAANTLIGAQGIADWVLVAEITSAWTDTSALVLHIAKKLRWLRLEIVGGTGAATLVNAFETQACLGAISNGEFEINPTASTKERFFFDGDSHRHAAQVVGILDQGIAATGTGIQLGPNTPDEFFDQWEAGDDGIVTQGGRGVSNRSQRVVIASVDLAAKTVTLAAQIGQAFTAGAQIMPVPKWFQIRAISAAGAMLARTVWIPTAGTAQEWIRTHVTFGGDT